MFRYQSALDLLLHNLLLIDIVSDTLHVSDVKWVPYVLVMLLIEGKCVS